MREIKINTIKHYVDIINFAKSQNPNDNPDAYKMHEAIQQTWYGYYCPYCNTLCKTLLKCSDCTLFAPIGCCNGLWIKMSTSKTWKEFIDAAIDVLIYICEKG